MLLLNGLIRHLLQNLWVLWLTDQNSIVLKDGKYECDPLLSPNEIVTPLVTNFNDHRAFSSFLEVSQPDKLCV